MECAKIREHLSEYIDGVLDKPTKDILEDHLLTCKDCSEELNSLKSIVKELSSLESVKAPQDFLYSLHQRIDSRFSLSKILNVLFVPTKSRIPFQLAATTVTVILVFAIFYKMQPFKNAIQEPQVSKLIVAIDKSQMDLNNIEANLEQKKITEETKLVAAKSIPKEYASIEELDVKEEYESEKLDGIKLAKKITVKPSIEKESKAPKLVEDMVEKPEESLEQKPIVLALLIRKKLPVLRTTPLITKKISKMPGEAIESIEEEAKVYKIRTKPVEKERYGIHTSSTSTVVAHTNRLKAKLESESIEEQEKLSNQRLPLTDAIINQRLSLTDADLLFSQLEVVVSKVEDLININKGEIISVEYDETSELLQSVIVEIPKSNYDSFCKELRNITALQNPPPDISEKDQKAIEVRIKFITSM